MLFEMFVKVNEWFRSQEEGQTLVEYALILVLIAIVVIAVLGLTGNLVRDIFTDINTELVVPGT